MPACRNTKCEFVAEKNVTFGVLRFYAARELTVRVTIGFRYLRSWLVSQFFGTDRRAARCFSLHLGPSASSPCGADVGFVGATLVVARPRDFS